MATRSLARLCALLACLLALVAASPARAGGMQPAARAHLQRGLKLYEQQHYEESIAELREGLAIDPQPDILYALGQAERKRGDCARAVEYYQSCLALVKDPAAAAAIKIQIERCEVKSGTEAAKRPFEVEPWPKDSAAAKAAPTPDTATLTTISPPPPSQPPPPPSHASASWARDPLAASVIAIGIGGVVAGGVMVGLARSRLDVAANSYQQYADARGWPGVWAGGIVSLSVGGALVALGVVRYTVVAKRAHRSSP